MSGWTPEKVSSFRQSFMEFLRYVKINSKETGGETILADHIYTAQNMFLDCVFEGLSGDIHDFKFLKSRQLGVSTISRALSIFWLGMHKGLQGAMVFDTFAHRDEAREELISMISDLPTRLKFPTIKKNSRDLLVLSNGSRLRFLNAGVRKSKMAGTLGRSSGLNFAHCSEMCSWDNDEGLVSFKNALSEKYPDRLMIWESTARGFNQWYKIWCEARADDLNQRVCFIGWWAKESQKIDKGTKSFDRYGLAPPNEREASRIKEVKEKYGFSVTDEQLAWYRRKTNPLAGDEEEDKTDDQLIMQEQPWTEDEAFQQTGSSFFAGEKITSITRTTATDKFSGYDFLVGSDFFRSDWFSVQRKNRAHLKVWQEPEEGGIYVLAADPAYGHDEKNNNSACQVLRCYADCLVQVAEYANSVVTTQPFAWVIASLAGWYKSTSVIIEINGPGEAVWNEFKSLKQLTTSGHMRAAASERGLRDIFTNVRDYMYARSDSMSAGQCFNWKTSTQLKVAIMERLRDFTNDGTLVLHSFEVLEEMKSIRREGDTIGAEGLNRDDRTYCLAMAIRCWEQSIRRALSTSGRTKEHEDAIRRLSIKDQVGLFNKHALDKFFKGRASERLKHQALARRNSWRR